MRLILTILALIAFSHVGQAQNDDFCNNLKAMLTSAEDYFQDQRGSSTSIEIRGVPKPYFESKTQLVKGKTLYLADNDYHPEAFTYVAEHSRGGDSAPAEMEQQYQKYKKLVESCISEGWKIEEKTKDNDIYLEDTNFKKLVLKQDKKGKKVKMELYIYNQRELDHWVVEFHFYGIGRKI
jgi:hypothetical protein